MGVHAGHRVRALLVESRLSRGGGRIREGQPAPGRAVVAAFAGRYDACPGR